MRLKLIAVILTLAVMAVNYPVSASAAPGYGDISDHWARDAIVKWSGLGILEGNEGRFCPSDPITRADMAVIIGRIMNYRTAAPNTFDDLSETCYTDAVLKANAAGVLLGDGNLIRPTAEVTREEAAVMLGRAFGMSESSAGAVFTDKAEISSWALGYVNAMASRGFMNGYQGIFNPKGIITRAEIVTVLDHAIAGLFAKPAEYTGYFSGIVVVNAPGVVLRDMVIDGDLIITQGVGAGEVTLANVAIFGSMIVRSGSVKAAGTTVGTAGMTGEAGVLGEKDAGDGGAVPGSVIPGGVIPGGSPDTGPPVEPPEEIIAAAPSFSYTYPKADDIGENTINILVMSGETVTYYAVAFKQSEERPEPASAQQVIDGTDGNGKSHNRWRGCWGPLDGDVEGTLEFKNLSSSTEYDVYIVAVDAAGNSSDVIKMTVATKAGPVMPALAWVARNGAADKGIMLQASGLDPAKLAAGLYVCQLKYYDEKGAEFSVCTELNVSFLPYDICQAMAFMPEGTAAVKARICERGGADQTTPVSDFSKALTLTYTEPATPVESFTYDGGSGQYTVKFSGSSETGRPHTLYVGYLTNGILYYIKISGVFPENPPTFILLSPDPKYGITVCEITGASVDTDGEASLTIARQADIQLD